MDRIQHTNEHVLHKLEQSTVSHRQISLLRIRLLSNKGSYDSGDDSGGGAVPVVGPAVDLASLVVPLLTQAVHDFVHQERMRETNAEYLFLRRVLHLFLRLVRSDSTLAEEMGRLGAHIHLTRLMRFSPCRLDDNDDDGSHNTAECDDIMDEIQNCAGEIAVASRPQFPMLTGMVPLTLTDLRARLPLVFAIPQSSSSSKMHSDSGNNNINTNLDDLLDTCNTNTNGATVLIRQVTERQTSQSDVGFVLWPSAVVLACWLTMDASKLTRQLPSGVDGALTVLELGAGCGLTGLAVARSFLLRNASSCALNFILTDFNSTVLTNLRHNVILNDLSDVCSVVGLDFYQQKSSNGQGSGSTMHLLQWLDMAGTAHEPVDIVLGADIICRPQDAEAIAQTLCTILKPNGVAYIVCANAAHRFGVECFVEQCQLVDMIVQTRNAGEIYDEVAQLHQLEQTAGYIEGMNLTLFTITKPIQ